MASKRNRQQSKMTVRKLSNILVWILLFLFFLYFLAFSIRNIIICRNINTGNLKEYSGRYEIRESRRSRNTLYYISLENGDVVRIDPELLENSESLTQYSSLHITYSTPKFGFPPVYPCIEATNIEGNMIFLSREISSNKAKLGIYTGLFLTLLVLIIPISYLLLSRVSDNLKKRGK